MSHHDLKIWPEYFQPKLDGKKPWEARNTRDREFNLGDTVTFQEYDLTAGGATGRTYGPVRITYVLKVDALHCIFTHTMLEDQGLVGEQLRRINLLKSDLRIVQRQMAALSERAVAAEEQLRLQGRIA
jgi:uncharacterized protein YjbI with pentapeptide repeats